MKMRLVILLLFSTLLTNCSQSDLSSHFGEFKGTMVLYDQALSKYTMVNEARAKTRFTPFSTFKIPNSIIALETAVVTDVEQIMVWDTLKYPAQGWWPQTWAGEHNLKTAIKSSVVPFYRNIAGLVGSERMQSYLTQFNYGNTDISSGIDNFWLNGSLKISAREQVEFLRKFYDGQLAVAQSSIKAVKSILIQEATGSYTLSYKTGGGSIEANGNAALGWLVGYVEKQENVYFFAMNIEGKSFEEVLAPRIEITKAILRELDIID